MLHPLILSLCCLLASTEYQLNSCRLVVALPLVTLLSHLSSRCTASRRAAHLPSRCTSWLLHCLSSSSHCAAPLVISLHQLVVASPIIVLLLCRPPVISLHQLVLALPPLVVLSLRRPLVLSSRRMVVASPLDAPPTCPLVAPPSHPLSAPADCCIASRRPLVAPPSCPPIAPAGCCIVSPCITLSSSHRVGWLLSYLSLRHHLVLLFAALSPRRLVVALPPSNAAAAIEHHRTPPPPPPPPPPTLPLPLSTAIFTAAPLSIAKERGSSSPITSVSTAAPT